LPNSPSLIYPGKNQHKLFNKRNRLLKKLYELGYFDNTTLELAISEPLPSSPFPLPNDAPHLLNLAVSRGYSGQCIRTTIDYSIQEQAQQTIAWHHIKLSANEIQNAACIIIDIKSNQILAYVGNTKPRKNDRAILCKNVSLSLYCFAQ
jgi:penicillin-binding protein 1C